MIRQASIAEIVALSQEIPEFDQPHGTEEYTRRLSGTPHLILVAEKENQLCGFKVGYQREKDGSFYSWMGAIHPAYRRQGIALALAEAQEAWAKENGFQAIRFKTRNRLKAMQIFALSRGFDIVGFEPRNPRTESRIILEKSL
ncbi:MAG: GNAT family N-acetyltransferase [Bacteroidota bacterium]